MKQKQFHKLVQAISRFGLDNVTILADYSDIPIETARYMIWHELPQHCISVGVDIDFNRIGLTQWMVKIDADRKLDKDVIASFFHDEIGLTSLLSVMLTNSLAMLLAIPENQHYKLERILEYLETSKVIQKYSMDKIEWIRHVSFDPSHYDLQKRKWTFDWKNIELESRIKQIDNSPIQAAPTVNGSNSPVDHKDLLILRAFQRRVPRSISKLEHIIGSDQHSLRYHYNKHVKSLIRGYYLKVVPQESDYQNLFLFVYESQSERDLAQARRIALSLPFTTVEWKTNREYAWLALWPGEYVNAAFGYLDQKITRLPGQLKHFLIDSKTELTQMLPCELFDDEAGMWKYEPKISLGGFGTVAPIEQEASP